MESNELRVVYKHYRLPADPLHTFRLLQNLSRTDVTGAECFFGRHGMGVHYQRGETPWEPLPRGGYTRCYVYKDCRLVAIGLAACNPKDGFCYREGRNRARSRAFLQLKTLFPGQRVVVNYERPTIALLEPDVRKPYVVGSTTRQILSEYEVAHNQVVHGRSEYPDLTNQEGEYDLRSDRPK